jgi:hypothetical protein
VAGGKEGDGVNIGEVLREMRDMAAEPQLPRDTWVYASLNRWADAIEAAMREKDAEIARLTKRYELARDQREEMFQHYERLVDVLREERFCRDPAIPDEVVDIKVLLECRKEVDRLRADNIQMRHSLSVITATDCYSREEVTEIARAALAATNQQTQEKE